MRSTTKEKRSFFFHPKLSGNPRYLPYPPSFSIPSVCFTLSFISWGVFDENEMDDFWLLICCPEASSYFCRIDANTYHQSQFQFQWLYIAHAVIFKLHL
ncbi:unnamed protein product [Microthlaspi erraticum]|uniref:Uncharacterized protein n=1 Tax=Microthlaspi erraticum TaxID=1685480 RepID=A0A6D2IQ94_9BRAS|nr:unnamed protein product [Microthlaspi erraticum]